MFGTFVWLPVYVGGGHSDWFPGFSVYLEK